MRGLGLVRPEPLLLENHCCFTAPTHTFSCAGKGLRSSGARRPSRSPARRDSWVPGACLGRGR